MQWQKVVAAEEATLCVKSYSRSRCEDIKKDGTRSSREGHGKEVKENGSRSRTCQEHARRTSTHAARMQSSILMQGRLRKNLLVQDMKGKDKTDETRQYRTSDASNASHGLARHLAQPQRFDTRVQDTRHLEEYTRYMEDKTRRTKQKTTEQ